MRSPKTLADFSYTLHACHSRGRRILVSMHDGVIRVKDKLYRTPFVYILLSRQCSYGSARAHASRSRNG
jgi:hypothetical protein